jgi:hypothetical protein
MKRFIYLTAVFLVTCAVSCATYPVKKEVNEDAKLKGAGKVGVIVRISQKGRVARDEIVTSISKTLPGYRHKRAVELSADIPSSITEFMNDSDSFYQSTSADGFLRYKSIGVVKSFVRAHETELKDEMTKNTLDLLVIYEVYTVTSVEMQMMKFSSVLAIVDKNLDLVYLDHQSTTRETDSSDIVSIKNEVVTHLSGRFIEKMMNFGWLAEL